MNQYKIGMIGGDGIGIEVVNGARIVLEAVSKLNNAFSLIFSDYYVSDLAIEKYGNPFPNETIDGISNSDAVLFGAAGGENNVTVINGLRMGFDLYAKVCPIKSFPGSKALYSDLDFIVVRENTEGVYRGVGYIDGDYYVNLRVFTKKGMERIIRFCFNLALKENRNKVTFTHKAQVLRYTDGPMLKLFYQIAEEYPTVVAEDMLVDTCAMWMAMRPQRFDIVLAENGNGDILSDLGGGLVGGLGFAFTGNIGDNMAVFEPTHGTGPDIAGKNIANPIAAIMSGKMLLDYIGEPNAGKSVQWAVEEVLREGIIKTPDLGGSSSTIDLAEAIAKKLETFTL
jgi:3-isopropylmalate dehydrogenase